MEAQMMYRKALPLLALLVAGGCDNDVTGPSGELQITKECSAYTGQAGSFCTITSSSLAAIPVGSRIVYATAAGATTLDTDIVLTPAGQTANSANGHCSLDFATGAGLCTLSGGTGAFAALSASVAVSYLAGPNWAWDGTYSYSD
jgi:hypothetical protein